MALPDTEKFPLLDAAGDRMLRRLRQHPHAPPYTHRIGERLSPAALARVRTFAQNFHATPADWLRDFINHCRREVPFYRRYTTDHFPDFPLLTREHLRREPWSFVPDSAPLDDLIVYTTSGTTGASLVLPATPEVPNRYLPLFQHALAAHNITLDGGPDRISILHLCAQGPRKTVTNCSVISFLHGAGFAKINLHPDDWNHPDDRARFIDDCNPEIYTGDPLAFHALAHLPTTTRPKAILSSATALFEGARQFLESHFRCPVIDIYSMNEAGPVAFSAPNNPHTRQLFPHKILAEILDDSGHPVPPGARGQIVLTGGINPTLPLLRYATGDYAARIDTPAGPALTRFEGRAPVAFRAADNHFFHSVDVSTVLHPFCLPFLQLHQNSDGSLHLETSADNSLGDEVLAALRTLFGPAQIITWQHTPALTRNRKPVTYSTDLTPPLSPLSPPVPAP